MIALRPPLQLHLCWSDATSKGSPYHWAQLGNDQDDADDDDNDGDKEKMRLLSIDDHKILTKTMAFLRSSQFKTSISRDTCQMVESSMLTIELPP